ncbi:hypothetical protein [Limnoglobus roseus]|uniref:Uncharacterized protein n=1 Tax=Limnoglobus roseus TaxID=2598579 RepID=A0A5C1APS4_9BACT|nr:hypothetical protein [Limnoglobus roseus]QEL18868.1 hypothetical protein PX52LOC_05910 [Limnoglobus roseus]
MTSPPPLIGTYLPPRVRLGDIVFCLYRDGDCKITSWHDGPIPWPRCSRVGGKGGGWGLLVNDTLKAAVMTESAAAVGYWFGVHPTTVWQWRRVFGVEHYGTEGSRLAHLAGSQVGADAMKAKEWTDEERDAKSATAKRIGLRPPGRWADGGWTIEELALLGTMPDKELAARIGRTWCAVRAKRSEKNVPAWGK